MAVTRSQFCNLLAGRLSRCWLGEETVLRERLEQVLDCRAAWLSGLARALALEFSQAGYADRHTLRVWLKKQQALKLYFKSRKRRELSSNVQFNLSSRNHRWLTPAIASEHELCQLLQIQSFSELTWLVAPHERRGTSVDHYVRTPIPKRTGGFRWIEEPRPKLKSVQRQILQSILPAIPLHPASHAYQSGRSIKTCAAAHVGQRIVLKMDLTDYFGSISLGRVRSLFANAGYRPSIALRLAQLCTAPARLEDMGEAARALTRTRLPQGGPASPGIANAVAYRVDRRLSGLAISVGAVYTRYADDLIFSGDRDFASRLDRFATSAAAIVMEEGFSVQFRKTRKLYHGAEQRILGITVNQKLNLNRRDFDALKAELHNCIHCGWQSQNLEQQADYAAHLRGRIAHLQALNPARGAKLLRLFDQISWDKSAQ